MFSDSSLCGTLEGGHFLALLESPWAVAPIWSFLTQYVLWDLLLALFLTPLIFALLTTGERAIARA